MSKTEETCHDKLRSASWKAFLLSDLSQLIDSKDTEISRSQSDSGNLSQDVQSVLDSKAVPTSSIQLIHSFLVSTIEFYCSAKNEAYSSERRLPKIAYILRQEGAIHDLEDLQWCFLSFCNHFIPEADSRKSLSNLFRLLIIYHDPQLSFNLESKRVSIENIASCWLSTAFAGVCSDSVTANIWSHVFSQPDPFLIIFIAYALLTSVGEKLTELTDENAHEFISRYPQSMQEEDVNDCIMFANYFLNRTPSTFRDVYAHIFHGGTCSPHFGDISVSSLCIPISVRDILSYHRDESVRKRIKFFFIDCRTTEDFEKGHNVGSFHVDSEAFLDEPSSIMDELNQALNKFRTKCKKGQDHICLIGYTCDDPVLVSKLISTTIYPILSQMLNMKYPRVSYLIEGYRGIHDCFFEEPNLLENHNPRFCSYCASMDSQTSKFLSETIEKGTKLFDEIKSTVKKTYDKSKKSPFFSFIKSQYSSFSESLGVTSEPICSMESLMSNPDHRFCFDCRELTSTDEEINIFVFLTNQCINFHKRMDGGDCQLYRSKGLTEIVRISTKSTDPEHLTFRFGRFEDSGLVVESMCVIKISNPDKLVKSIKLLMNDL